MGESVRNATLAVDGASVMVSESQVNGQRKTLVITNTSTGGQVIALSWGQEAVAGSGIILYPTGAWSESLDSKYTPSNERIFAIGSAAGGSIAIHERIVMP